MISDLGIPGDEKRGRYNSLLWWGWKSVLNDRVTLKHTPHFTLKAYASRHGEFRQWIPRPSTY